METVLSNFVSALNNAMQSYITYLYVHEICQTLIMLMFVVPIMILVYRVFTHMIQDIK